MDNSGKKVKKKTEKRGKHMEKSLKEEFFTLSAKFLNKPVEWVKEHDNGRSDRYVKNIMAWKNLSSAQQEAWYLSGEGRILTFRGGNT
jgi:hypothetical protein